MIRTMASLVKGRGTALAVVGFVTMKLDQIPRRRTVEDAGPYKEIDSFVFSMKVYQTVSVHLIRQASAVH